MEHLNGNSPDSDEEEVYVRFGPRPTQVIPVSWAEKIIQNYMLRYPGAFAKIMGEVSLEGYRKETKSGTAT